jgi:hypothetical protein
MSITNPTQGLQLDANTLVLFKSIAEIGGDHVVGTDHNYIDSGPNGYDAICNTSSAGPFPTNGPLGPAGAVSDTPQFAAAYRYNLPNVGGRQVDVSPEFAIDQDFNDAFRDVGGFVQQTMFYYDPIITPGSTFVMGMATGSSTSTGSDVFNLLYLSSSLQVRHRMERENADATFSSNGAVITPGVWTVITSVWLPDGGTGYDCDVYMHELNAGVVTGGLKNSHSGGLQPVAASGLNIDWQYGLGQFFTQWQGALAFGRTYKGQLDLANVTAQAEELLLTGTLATIPNTDDLFRHEFNDAPGWIDEGPIGLHAWARTESADFASDDSDNLRHIDVVGSGGRGRQGCTANKIHNVPGSTRLDPIFPGAGSRLEAVFNADVLAIPEYTWQMVGLWGNGASTNVLEWFASGEPSYTNYLFRWIVDMATGDFAFFAEEGGGVNITTSNLISAGAIDDTILQQTMLLTFRVGENPASPGVMRYRVSINDQLDVASGDLSAVPTDGEHGYGPDVRWPTGGYLQEVKLTLGEITNQNIIDDFARLGDREGALGDSVTYRMRAYDTDLSRHVFWGGTSIDDTGDQYAGNSGALTNIVVQNVVCGDTGSTPAPSGLPVTAGLANHLDASTQQDITWVGAAGDGEIIASIADISTLSGDWTKGAGAVRWFDNKQNGLGSLVFTGGQEFLTTPPILSGSNPGEIFAVMRKNNGATNQSNIWRMGAAEDANTSSLATGGSKVQNNGFGSTTMSGNFFQLPFLEPGPVSLGNYVLINCHSAENDWVYSVNQTVNMSDSVQGPRPSTVGWSALDWVLGGKDTGTSGGAALDLGECLIFNRKLSTEERSAMRTYLIDKWDITWL